jgi:hypothetical protein
MRLDCNRFQSAAAGQQLWPGLQKPVAGAVGGAGALRSPHPLSRTALNRAPARVPGRVVLRIVHRVIVAGKHKRQRSPSRILLRAEIERKTPSVPDIGTIGR